MKHEKLKMLTTFCIVLICIALIVVYITKTNRLTAWNLLSSAGTERDYLPVVLSSHTPPTVTAVPTNTPVITITPLPTSAATATPIHSPTMTATGLATATPTATAVASATPTSTPPSGNVIIIDHHAVALFEQIPDQYVEAAADLHMLFIDRSVGANIDDGLVCLSFESDEDAPHRCSIYQHVAPEFSVDPAVVSWYRPGGYDRTNWDYITWEVGNDCNRWQDKVRCFLEIIDPMINQYDVVSFQFSYLAVAEGSTIADQPGGYLWDTPDDYDVFDQEVYEAQHPDKVFIYWTTSLSRGIGSGVSDTFNDQMRQYAVVHDKVLFDVAAILSHDPEGHPCYDNRDGIPYSNGNNSENYPDDGVDRLAICQHYTSEVDGGHLGNVSAGKIRVSKAFWVLMARLAGWDGTPAQ